MKKIIPLLVILILSCNVEDKVKTEAEIKSDLSGLISFLSVIEAGLSLIDEDSLVSSGAILNKTSSRALDPTSVSESGNLIMVDFFGSDWQTSPKTPHEVFTSKGTSGQALRIPTTPNTYISNIYSNVNNDFYLTMEEVLDKQYRIKLYIYPRDDFNTNYVYEEYLVNEDDSNGSWAWSNFDNLEQTNSWIKQVTYYRDGSKKTRDTKWSNSGSKVDEVYSEAPSLAFSVANLLTDYSDYTYFTNEPVYTVSSSSQFYSSKTLGVLRGNRKSREIIEYYTEEQIVGGYIMRNVQFIEGSKRWDTVKTVTRSNKDTSTGESNYISLSISGGEWNQNTEIERISKTNTTYKSEKNFWYSNIDSVSTVNDANSVVLDLTKNGTTYSGTSTQYWGSSGEVYNYSIDTLTGEITSQWTSSTSRLLSNQKIVITDLSDITISGNGWLFKGYYELGELIGKYEANGYGTEVAISLIGIEIDGQMKKWLE